MRLLLLLPLLLALLLKVQWCAWPPHLWYARQLLQPAALDRHPEANEAVLGEQRAQGGRRAPVPPGWRHIADMWQLGRWTVMVADECVLVRQRRHPAANGWLLWWCTTLRGAHPSRGLTAVSSDSSSLASDGAA